VNEHELIHEEHLALGERLNILIAGRHEDGDPSLIFTVTDDETVEFYGSAEAAVLCARDRRFWSCCKAYWHGLLDNGMEETVLRTFVWAGTPPTCHEDAAACRKANAAYEEAQP
jgi:hypothetical protein